MTVADAPTLAPAARPEAGQLARVRGRMWVVGDVVPDSQASLDGRSVQHLVSLVSVEDDATREELEVVWEIEPGTQVIERAELPASLPTGSTIRRSSTRPRRCALGRGDSRV